MDVHDSICADVGEFQVEGDDATRAQMEAFATLAQSWRWVVDQKNDRLTYVSSHADWSRRRMSPEMLSLEFSLQQIGAHSRNVVPCHITPTFPYHLSLCQNETGGTDLDVTTWFHEIVDSSYPYSLLKEFESGEECICGGQRPHSLQCMIGRRSAWNNDRIDPLIRSPKWWSRKTWVSGGNVDGVIKNLQLMEREMTVPRVSPQHLLTAVMRVLKQIGPVEPPKMDNETLRNIPINPLSSSGFCNYSTEAVDIGDFILEYVNSITQDKAEFVNKKDLIELVEKVRNYIKTTGKRYDRSWFPYCVAKMSLKNELKKFGSDPTKTRIFFIMSMMLLLLDKALYSNAFKASYQRAGIAIGHQWRFGGGERLARKFRARSGDYIYVETDAEKLDQSLLGQLLAIVFLLPLVLYKWYSTTWTDELELIRSLMIFRADDIAATLVKWVGEDARWVIGVMFSGLFGTSWGDSVYVTLAMNTFDMHVLEQMRAKGDTALAAQYKKDRSRLIWDVYGDDVLLAVKRTYANYVVDREGSWPGPLNDYLKKTYGIALKPSDTHVYDSFFSEIRFLKNPKDGAPCGLFEWVRKGPKFLQRRFLLDKDRVLTTRETTDYWMRIAKSTGQVFNKAIWNARWVGLQIDTQGTNPYPFRILAALRRKALMYLKEKVPNFDPADMNTWDLSDQRDADLHRRMMKMGFGVDDFSLIQPIDQSWLRYQFYWNEEYQKSLCSVNRWDHYERDGSVLSAPDRSRCAPFAYLGPEGEDIFATVTQDVFFV